MHVCVCVCSPCVTSLPGPVLYIGTLFYLKTVSSLAELQCAVCACVREREMSAFAEPFKSGEQNLTLAFLGPRFKLRVVPSGLARSAKISVTSACCWQLWLMFGHSQ